MKTDRLSEVWPSEHTEYTWTPFTLQTERLEEFALHLWHSLFASNILSCFRSALFM